MIFFSFIYSLQRATLAEKEVNTLKEQLSSTSISSQNSSMQNGCLAPPSLASPAMSEASSSGNPIISSKSLNNNKDEINDDKMDTTNEIQSTSNRSSPVSMVENKRDTIEHLGEDDDDDDDIVPIPSTVTSLTTNSLIGSTAITTASNALTNTSAASKMSSVASDVNDSEGKSCDEISAKDKEVCFSFCFRICVYIILLQLY